MKIMMIPGERNEELILKVHEATVECRADENSDAIDIFIDEWAMRKPCWPEPSRSHGRLTLPAASILPDSRRITQSWPQPTPRPLPFAASP